MVCVGCGRRPCCLKTACSEDRSLRTLNPSAPACQDWQAIRTRSSMLWRYIQLHRWPRLKRIYKGCALCKNGNMTQNSEAIFLHFFPALSPLTQSIHHLKHLRRGRRRSSALVAHSELLPSQLGTQDTHTHRHIVHHANALCHFHISASINPNTGAVPSVKLSCRCCLQY